MWYIHIMENKQMTNTNRKAVYCDMDGTVANCEHRRHHLDQNRWDLFFGSMGDDGVYEHTLNVLKALKAQGWAIVIGTARPNENDYHQICADWLARAGVEYDALYMRKGGDYRKDSIVKIELLEEMLADGWDIQFALDDRDQVVKAFRDYGLPVMQVNAGDFDTNKVSRYVKDNQGKVLLDIMVGPSGAGKSTYIEKNYKPSDVISSDAVREQLFGGHQEGQGHSQEELARTWSYVHSLVKARLEHGVFTVLDATNIKRKDRMTVLEHLPKGIMARYVVIDREYDQKLKTRGWRPETLISKHHNTFKSNLKDILKGDDHPYVVVDDKREHKI